MGRDMATSQDFVNWVCSDAILPNFLKFLLLAQGDEIRRFASGSVQCSMFTHQSDAQLLAPEGLLKEGLGDDPEEVLSPS